MIATGDRCAVEAASPSAEETEKRPRPEVRRHPALFVFAVYMIVLSFGGKAGNSRFRLQLNFRGGYRQ